MWALLIWQRHGGELRLGMDVGVYSPECPGSIIVVGGVDMDMGGELLSC